MSNFSESHKIVYFIEMQNWRSESKKIAKEILEKF